MMRVSLAEAVQREYLFRSYEVAVLQLHELVLALVLVDGVVVCYDALAIDGGLDGISIVSCSSSCLHDLGDAFPLTWTAQLAAAVASLRMGRVSGFIVAAIWDVLAAAGLWP